MKKLLVFSGAIVSVWALSASLGFAQTLAQSESLQKAESELDASIAELGKDEATELLKKVDAFKKVVSFTRAEISELTEKLELVDRGFGDDLWDFYKAMGKHLSSASQELSEFESRIIDNDSTLADIKALASEFKEWRENGYNLRNKALFDLIILDKSEQIVDVAENRGVKIGKDLNKFKKEFGELGSLQLRVLFAKAQLEIGRAENLQEEAKALFKENYTELFFPSASSEEAEAEEDATTTAAEGVTDEAEAENTASSTAPDSEAEESVDEDKGEGEAEIEEEDSADPATDDADEELPEEVDVSQQILGMIEQARVGLASGYQFFIDMSELAKQLLSEE